MPDSETLSESKTIFARSLFYRIAALYLIVYSDISALLAAISWTRHGGHKSETYLSSSGNQLAIAASHLFRVKGP